MEWNTEIPDIPKGTTRWFASPNGITSSYFFHFSTQGSVASSYWSHHASWRDYSLVVPLERKVSFLRKEMNWDSFDFAMNNAKWHKRPGFPAEYFGAEVLKNITKNRNYGDIVLFHMFLPFPKEFHPATIRGWVEAKVYPGSDLMSFRNAKIMFL